MKKLLIICLMLVCALVLTACGQVKQEQAPKAEPATAVFNTSMGDFEVKLATDYAPETSKNFITLAEKGFYNGRTLFEIHHIVFIGVLCEKFLIFDQCLNFVNRFFYFFFSIFAG